MIVLARHYAHLEALAFDEPWDESIAATVDDNTTPLHESMHQVRTALKRPRVAASLTEPLACRRLQRAGAHMVRWKESIAADPTANSYVLKAAPKKRATSPDSKAKAQIVSPDRDTLACRLILIPRHFSVFLEHRHRRRGGQGQVQRWHAIEGQLRDLRFPTALLC
jgi:hypothetical protein